MLDLTFFLKVGPKVVERYRDHIFNKAKDVFGKPFKGYSTYGSKWVTMNVKKSFRQSAPKEGYSYSQAKKGKMLKRQDQAFANKNSPVASGDLYRDFGMIGSATSTGFKFGWNTFGARVQHLKDMKRVLTTKQQPMPEKVIKYLSKESHGYIKKKLGKNKTTIHKIGKK